MRLLLLCLIALNLYANEIGTLIQKAFANNPTILKLQEQIKASNYTIANSKLYKNPNLSMGLNNINLDDPTNRGLEAMQTNFIVFSQQFTNSAKLKMQTQIEISKKDTLKLVLDEEKNKIVKELYRYFYQYEELVKKIELNGQKIVNFEKINDYLSNNIQNQKAFQEILNNDIMIENALLELEIDKQKQEQFLIEISNLVNEPIDTIDPLNKELSFQNSFKKEHTLLKIQEKTIETSKFQKNLAFENQSSDYTLSGGYYHRDSFDDYVSVALKIPLNIYGREENTLLESTKNIDVSKQSYEVILSNLKRKFELEKSKQSSATKSIIIVQNIIENLQKEKELIENQNSSDSLVQILKIENKILQNHMMQESFKRNLNLAKVELAYLNSALGELYDN